MLHGRHTEQVAIDRLLDNARGGISGAAILRGQPGIGKTALLDYAQDSATGLRVLRGAGIDSEASLPFAGLYLVLRRALDGLDALPGPQRRALAGAFGLDSASGDRFMVGAAVLSLLADLAERGPLLCLVDDAHWLDHASLDALLFAARRLDRERVVLLFAARDYPDALRMTGLPEIHLFGLDAQSAAALLDEHGNVLMPAVRERLIAETQGNPLALRELAALPSAPDSWTGPIPLTSRVLDAFLHQVRTLPDACQTLLAVAAADDTGDLPVLLSAARQLGVGVGDLQPAEAARLVSVDDGTLTFRHPLIRAAVYHDAGLAKRIAVHTALASAFAEHRDGDRRAWHLAAAATGPDEAVAASLEQAAVRAAARNGHAVAASGYERASRLSPEPDGATRRLVLACEAGVSSGQLDWAKTRAQEGLQRATDALSQARLTDVMARAEFAGGAMHRAHELFMCAADLVGDADPERAFWMLMGALHAAWAATPTDLRMISEPADRFDVQPVARPVALQAVAWLARWATAASLDRDTGSYPPFELIIEQARAAAADAGPRGMVDVASFSFIAARDAVCADVNEQLVDRARADGMIFALPGALGQLSLAQAVLGWHREALINGTEAVRIAKDIGQPLWERYACGALAYLAAVEGDGERCRANAMGAELDAEAPVGSSVGTTWEQYALALLDLGHGRLQAAYDRFQATLHGPIRHHSAVQRCVPDLVEAAVRLGRPDEVADAMAQYRRWASVTAQPWVNALVARCEALLTRGGPAEQHFARALALHEASERPFDRARTALLYGEWLRRERRKLDARTQLTQAVQLFDGIRSTPWAARARAELAATGAGVPRTVASDKHADLTPQELQITQLAADGLSNRDIAARLFLSPRTVAYHLYKAYPKLGITARTELAALDRATGGQQSLEALPNTAH